VKIIGKNQIDDNLELLCNHINLDDLYFRYEMIYGKRPFEHQNSLMVKEMIKNSDVCFPVQTNITDDAKDLI
jgi:hypothetical protein